MDLEGNNVSSEKHSPEFDTDSINQAVETASKDHGFINSAINLIREMKFPAFKKDIISYVKNVNTDRDIVALFESLDGYIQYRDLYHVQKALEENNPERKKTYQITDASREQPAARTRATTIDGSIKEREVQGEAEERKDYPEVPPSAMSNFICNTCGKQFQNQNDLIQHQRFEGTEKNTDVSK
ncbi:MAG TPA: C2H2-type zinc finger protein [Nitrososphaeraceae archaeon]